MAIYYMMNLTGPPFRTSNAIAVSAHQIVHTPWPLYLVVRIPYVEIGHDVLELSRVMTRIFLSSRAQYVSNHCARSSLYPKLWVSAMHYGEEPYHVIHVSSLPSESFHVLCFCFFAFILRCVVSGVYNVLHRKKHKYLPSVYWMLSANAVHSPEKSRNAYMGCVATFAYCVRRRMYWNIKKLKVSYKLTKIN